MKQDEIYAKYPHLKSDNFKQKSLAYAASYYYVLDGDFIFSDGKNDYVLKQNLNLDIKNLKPICQGESGYKMGELFLSTVPWACEHFTNAHNLDYKNFKKLKDDLISDISAFSHHKISVSEFIGLIHNCVKNRLKSNIITDEFRIVLTLENSESVLLNSFYIDDISKILASNDINQCLMQIFDENDPKSFKRIDTRKDENLDILIEKLGKNCFPLGAFASEYMLIFHNKSP